MFLDELERLLRRSWMWIVAATLIGAIVGAGAALLRAPSFVSQAVTAVGVNYEVASTDNIQPVGSNLNQSMPTYLAASTGTDVVQAAADASGLPAADVEKRLTTARDPESTVLAWTFAGDSPEAAQKGLTAATDTFADYVAKNGPQSSRSQPLAKVTITQPAGPGEMRRTSPLLGGAAGALAGAGGALLAALLMRRGSRFVTDRDSVELSTSLPVLAELGGDSLTRAEQMRYVAAYLARYEATDDILVVGRTMPGAADVDALDSALRAEVPNRTPSLRMMVVGQDGLAQEAARSDAVVVVLVRNVDDLEPISGELQSIRRVCRGPVVAVIDAGRRSRLRVRRPAPTETVRA